MVAVNHPCSWPTSVKPCSAMSSRAPRLSAHSVVEHSSPPRCTKLHGKMSTTSSTTRLQNSKVPSFRLSTCGDGSQAVRTSSGSLGLPSSGYAAMAACMCPGMSISARTSTCLRAAKATISTRSCLV